MNPFKKIVLLLIKAYKATKPLRPARCRFYPSCSQYAQEAISRHGLVQGLLLISVRIVKCQPFHPGGVDEVPNTEPLTSLNNWFVALTGCYTAGRLTIGSHRPIWIGSTYVGDAWRLPYVAMRRVNPSVGAMPCIALGRPKSAFFDHKG